jgi:hypothetical protein
VGTAMTSFTPLTASGGTAPYSYSYTGTLPAGLAYSTTTGAVTGTPTTTFPTASLLFSVKDSTNAVASTTSKVNFTVGSSGGGTASGFVGRTWSSYAVVDASNTSIYPVVGISSTGVAYGAWLQNLITGSGVATGSINTTSASSWTLNGLLPMGSATSTFSNSLYGFSTGQIDIAVSPANSVFTAWVAGTYIWYSTNSSGSWTTPVQLSSIPTTGPIKVVNDDAGDAAIAYCTSTGTQVLVYTKSTNSMQAPKQISSQCIGSNGLHNLGLQNARAYDIAMNNSNSVITAVGLVPSTTTLGDFVVASYIYTPGSGWSSATPISGDISPTALTNCFSLSYSQSPSGAFAGVAWAQLGASGFSNVYTSLYKSGVWGTITPLQTNNSIGYLLPLIAVNDSGSAFASLGYVDVTHGGTYIYVSNYSVANGWMAAPYIVDGWGNYTAVDIAIDQYGNGLLSHNDSGLDSAAGSFTSNGVWSGFTVLSPTYGYKSFHYQSMKSLPDGRAILVTSAMTSSGFASSGFVMLK